MSNEPTKRVVLIDDEIAVVEAVTFLLSTMDCSVDSFSNGKEAIDCLENHSDQYACAFVDLAMPIIDGLETRRLIREFAPEFHLILTTGYTDRSVPDDVLQDPYTHFLKKPFSYDGLAACLQKFQPEIG